MAVSVWPAHHREAVAAIATIKTTVMAMPKRKGERTARMRLVADNRSELGFLIER